MTPIIFLFLILGGDPRETKSYALPDGKTVVLLVPFIEQSYKLIRLPGSSWEGPHGDCLMCLGNHLIGGHDISLDYLYKINYSQWFLLHNNLHNDKNLKGHVYEDAQVIGYGNVPAPGGSYIRGRGFW